MARQTLFTEELFERILELHADGETIEDVCRIEGMPKPSTFYEWLADTPALAKRFTIARRVAMDCIAAKSRRTARGKTEEQGGESSGDVQRDKLIIEQDNKLLAKWDTRYNDRLTLAGDGDSPLTVVVRKLTDA